MSIDHADLAARFGTPYYVYDGAVLQADFRRLRSALPDDVEVFHSLKANPNISVVDLLRRSGARAEVCSLTELHTALRVGTNPEDVVFLGPGKGSAEIAACVQAGIHAVVAESLDELELIDRHAADHGRRQRVLLRINPARPASAARLAMGGRPRQFGIDEQQVLDAGPDVLRFAHLDVAGVHAYLGTRILDAAAVVENTRQVLDLAVRVAERTGMPLDTVDVGGGFGVPYFAGESPLDLAETAVGLREVFGGFREQWPTTRLMVESGRFLTARSGTYVVSVRSIKRSQGELFAVTDGGTHQHMAAVGVGSVVKRNFPVSLLGRDAEESIEEVHVSGLLCTPSDLLAKKVQLPALRPGDLLGVQMSGAYGPTASPVAFLGHGHPAEILVRDGRAHLVRRRDTAEDLLSRQILVPELLEE